MSHGLAGVGASGGSILSQMKEGVWFNCRAGCAGEPVLLFQKSRARAQKKKRRESDAISRSVLEKGGLGAPMAHGAAIHMHEIRA